MKDIVKIFITLLITLSSSGEQVEVEVEITPPIIMGEENWEIPCSTSSVKTYMDYRAITLTSSAQYQYIQEHMTIHDGLLYSEDGYIGVALGSWWGDIGDKWIIELDTGITLKVVKIDEKADRHVNNGCQHKKDYSVIEFVVDGDTIPSDWRGSNGYVFNGNFNNSDLFKGNINKVKRPFN